MEQKDYTEEVQAAFYLISSDVFHPFILNPE